MDVYSGAKANAPPAPPLSVSSAAERMDQSIEHVQVLTKRLQAINDRLHGGEPRAISGGGGLSAAVPSALLPMLRMRNENLAASLDVLSKEIERIEAAL